MRSGTFLFAVLGSLAVMACGPAELAVTAELEVANPDGEGTIRRQLPDLEIRLLPYDRDVIFDSLTNVASTPEPSIPDSLLEAQSRVAEAQSEWQSLDGEWALLREELQDISDRLETLNRAESQYRVLFREFQDKEARLGAVERQRDAAFTQFDGLQQSTIQQADAVRLLREAWGDEAFVDFSTVVLAKLQASGLDPVTDTTDASGLAVFAAPAGQYWVYARWERMFDELYWNVPFSVEGGDPISLLLNADNAQVRPIL